MVVVNMNGVNIKKIVEWKFIVFSNLVQSPRAMKKFNTVDTW